MHMLMKFANYTYAGKSTTSMDFIQGSLLGGGWGGDDVDGGGGRGGVGGGGCCGRCPGFLPRKLDSFF